MSIIRPNDESLDPDDGDYIAEPDDGESEEEDED